MNNFIKLDEYVVKQLKQNLPTLIDQVKRELDYKRITDERYVIKKKLWLFTRIDRDEKLWLDDHKGSRYTYSWFKYGSDYGVALTMRGQYLLSLGDLLSTRGEVYVDSITSRFISEILEHYYV